MTAKDLEERIEKYYDDHRYPVANVYLFGWESDFLTFTKEGLIYEFEIKLSRSDFRADFEKKDKHRILASWNKKGLSVRHRDRDTWDDVPIAHSTEFVAGDARHSWDRGYHKCNWRHDIYVDDIKQTAPNRFFYVCPVGIIPVDQVPDYAGLIMVGESFTICKKAPLLHKTKRDFAADLLDKYYYKYLGMAQKQYLQQHYKEQQDAHQSRMIEFIKSRGLVEEYGKETGYDLPYTK